MAVRRGDQGKRDVGMDEEFIKTLWDGAVADDDENIAATIKAPSSPGLEENIVTIQAVGDAQPTRAAIPGNSLMTGFLGGATQVTFRGGNSITLRQSRMVEGAEKQSDRIDALLHGGDFIVKRVVGQGGMGVVYIASQTSLNRDVAVKMILPNADSENSRQKLVAEALVTGELEHPNIIPIYELGQTDKNKLFYAMKIVDGKPWSDELPANSERQNIDILLRVADAVAFAHDKGVIHRDLKPENVMLGGYGEVLLMDWGLAVSQIDRGRAEPLNQTNAKAGTPAYMAPEMARGEVDRIGPASDIYLLGAILFEILTGRRPHGGRNVYICLRAAAENYLQPTERADSLLQVARKAMATDPAERHASVKAFQQDVREVLAHTESLNLVNNAELSLHAAEAAGSYEDYSQAIFAYREAITLWEENQAAHSGLVHARKRYAARAFANGDYDLAAFNLEGLTDPEATALSGSVARAKADAEARKRRVRKLTTAAIALTAAVVVILAGSTIIISDRMAREREAREEATRQEQIARRALVETQEARERESQAAAERAEAQQQAFAALAREKSAQDDRLAAIAREEEERRQREEAERAQRAIADEMARLGQLEDDSWWAFDSETALSRQRAAAEAAGVPVRLTLNANQVELDFSFIPAGEFVMGSNPREPVRQPDEYLHRVVLTKPFYLGETEVTRAQWRAVVGMEREEDLMPEFHAEIMPQYATWESFRSEQLALWGWRVRPLEAVDLNLPATSVSPHEIESLFIARAAAFAPEGWVISLPTEAEWEYAARAGTSTQFFNGDLDDAALVQGWTQEKSGLRLHPVRGWEANAWGLFDTHGNAAEIVQDAHSVGFYLASPILDPVNDSGARYRVVRGGSVIHSIANSRSASRTNIHQDNRYRQAGFRAALHQAKR
ncbi:MAG: SUMF1/EgtB/PvdO family nonheme iron enzyme [Planctomycetes bacterium]|nr:SUMF1/EgtB/PvdO family nonheme iron enzyme [Planctomycetota bacterium]